MSDENVTAEFIEWQDSLEDKDHLIVIQRACNDYGYDYELRVEGGLTVDGDLEDPGFMLACHERYLHMYIGDALYGLAEEGLITPSRIDENGEVCYVRVEA